MRVVLASGRVGNVVGNPRILNDVIAQNVDAPPVGVIPRDGVAGDRGSLQREGSAVEIDPRPAGVASGGKVAGHDRIDQRQTHAAGVDPRPARFKLVALPVTAGDFQTVNDHFNPGPIPFDLKDAAQVVGVGGGVDGNPRSAVFGVANRRSVDRHRRGDRKRAECGVERDRRTRQGCVEGDCRAEPVGILFGVKNRLAQRGETVVGINHVFGRGNDKGRRRRGLILIRAQIDDRRAPARQTAKIIGNLRAVGIDRQIVQSDVDRLGTFGQEIFPRFGVGKQRQRRIVNQIPLSRTPAVKRRKNGVGRSGGCAGKDQIVPRVDRNNRIGDFQIGIGPNTGTVPGDCNVNQADAFGARDP